MMRKSWFVTGFLLVMLLSAVAPGFAASKEWTWMVFMNGDNNLDPFADEDFTEMMKVGSSDFLNIVTLTDREKGPATLNYVEKGRVVTLKQMGELDMGDYQVMIDFVRQTVRDYPAKRYVLSIWNHGSGWKNRPEKITKGISYDDSSGNHITTPQLGAALKQIKKLIGKNLDILSMDACLMQMMEVAWEIHDSCDFIVASEELEPGHGYSYHTLLAGLKPGITPEAFCRHWIPDFIKAYSGAVYEKESCTLSVLRCSALPAVRDAIDGFAKGAMAGKYAVPFKQALGKVQKFDERTNIDLPHFIKLLSASINSSEMRTAFQKLEKALTQAIIANGNTGGSLKNANGLAVYFPAVAPDFESHYAELRFARESLYDEMIKDYYQKKQILNVVADVQNGDLTSLHAYVKTAGRSSAELNRFLLTEVNFLVLSEGRFPRSFQREVAGALKPLLP